MSTPLQNPEKADGISLDNILMLDVDPLLTLIEESIVHKQPPFLFNANNLSLSQRPPVIWPSTDISRTSFIFVGCVFWF